MTHQQKAVFVTVEDMKFLQAIIFKAADTLYKYEEAKTGLWKKKQEKRLKQELLSLEDNLRKIIEAYDDIMKHEVTLSYIQRITLEIILSYGKHQREEINKILQ